MVIAKSRKKDLTRNRFIKRNKFTSILVPAAFLLIVVATGAFLLLRERDSNQATKSPISFPEVNRDIEINHPKGWKEKAIDDIDKIKGVLVKLQKESPKASFVARTMIGELEKEFEIKIVSDEVIVALKKSLDNFHLVRKEITRIDSFDAVEIQYKQTSANDNEVYEYLMIIIPTQNQTFYLTFRSKEDDFRLIKKDAQEISKSFADHINQPKR